MRLADYLPHQAKTLHAGDGVIGDSGVLRHLKKMQKLVPNSGKESAEQLLKQDSLALPIRSTFRGGKPVTGLESVAGRVEKCPKCKGSNIVLMPTDYETAKCKDCGKTWQAKNPPMPGDSVKAKATGLVKKVFTIEAKPDVMERFQKFLAHVQWCCNVGHSTEVVMSVDGDGPDAFYVMEKLPKFAESKVRTVKVTGEKLS